MYKRAIIHEGIGVVIFSLRCFLALASHFVISREKLPYFISYALRKDN